MIAFFVEPSSAAFLFGLGVGMLVASLVLGLVGFLSSRPDRTPVVDDEALRALGRVTRSRSRWL